MGFFSELALAKEFVGNRPDISFPDPICEIKQRILDLEERLDRIKLNYGYSDTYIRYAKEDLSSILPKYLYNIRDVEIALNNARMAISETEEMSDDDYLKTILEYEESTEEELKTCIFFPTIKRWCTNSGTFQ